MEIYLRSFIMLAIGSGTFAQFSQNINPNLNIGSVQYCTDLQPASLEIKTVLGTWFGYQLYTHYDTVSGNRYFNPCVYITIHEINHETANVLLQNNANNGVTQFGPVNAPPNQNIQYRFLRLEWTENQEKFEYILRYNMTRRGFWLSAAPYRFNPSDGQSPYNLGHFTGTIQVLKADTELMMLTFCETVPKRQLYSVVLTRRFTYLQPYVVSSLHQSLRSRGLPTILDRRLCANSSTMININLRVIAATFVILISLAVYRSR